MRIDERKFKRSLPPASLSGEVRSLLDGAEGMREEEFLAQLESNLQWKAPKMELIVWANVLDRCDQLLAQCLPREGEPWNLPVDDPDSPLRPKLRLALAFIHELFENTTSRTCFSSFDRLVGLLDSSDMEVVHWVLTVVQTISRRTQLMVKLKEKQKQRLVELVEAVATPWEPSNLSIADWAQLSHDSVPSQAKALSFHYQLPSSSTAPSLHILVPDVCSQGKSVGRLMLDLRDKLAEGGTSLWAGREDEGELREEGEEVGCGPTKEAIRLHAALRLASSLSSPRLISTSLIARLQALQILLYSGLLEDSKISLLLPSNLLFQLVAVLKLTEASHRELQCETFRTLIAIIHYDRTNMLESLIVELSVSAFHGFLPSLVRERLSSMTAEGAAREEREENLTTAMMSFVYHLSNYEAGREALVSSGLLQSLITMVRWEGCQSAQMQFVTRSVRLIDIMLHSIHLPTFTTLGGFPAILNRLASEVERCRTEEPYVMGEIAAVTRDGGDVVAAAPLTTPDPQPNSHVLPKRAALIKSLQNFLKRVIATPNMGTLTSHMMNSSLPRSLAHIISNQNYYGPALFLQSIELVTLFIQSQPSELTTLQERGLIAIVQKAMLEKDMPANREFLCKLFHVITALCTNTRGLNGVKDASVFDKALSVLTNPQYVSALKRGRRSDSGGLAGMGSGDTASELGSSCDELIKHHAELRSPAVTALIRRINHLVELGSNPAYRAVLKPSASPSSSSSATFPTHQPSNTPSLQPSEENSDEDEMETEASPSKEMPPPADSTPVPLPDYIANLAKFTDAFLGSAQQIQQPVIPNQRTCEEFMQAGGGNILVQCLTLKNLPPEMATSTACMGPLTKLIVNLASIPRDHVTITTSLCEGAAEAAVALNISNSSSASTPDETTTITSTTTTTSMTTIMSSVTSDSFASLDPRQLFFLSNHLACLIKILGAVPRSGSNLKPWLKLLPVLPQLNGLYQMLEQTSEAKPAEQSLEGKLRTQLKDLLLALSRLGQSPGHSDFQDLNLPGRRARDAALRGSQLRREAVESIAIAQKLWTSLALVSETPPSLLRSQLRLYSQLLFGESGNAKPSPSTLRAFNDTGALTSIFNVVDAALQQRLALPAPQEDCERQRMEGLESLVEAALNLILKLVDPASILLSSPVQLESASLPSPDLSSSEVSLRFLKVVQGEAIHLISEVSDHVGVWMKTGVVEATMGIWSVLMESQTKLEEAEEEITAAKNPHRIAQKNAERMAELERDVDPVLLSNLMDMGFERSAALAALNNHENSLDAAAEYLLSLPSTAQHRAPTQHFQVDEEEELRRAIALSITATSPPPAADNPAPDQPNQSAQPSAQPVDSADTASPIASPSDDLD